MSFFTVYHGNNESAMFNAECTVGSLLRCISDTLLAQCPRAYARLELVPLSFVADNFPPPGHGRGGSVVFSEPGAPPPLPRSAPAFSGSIPFVGLSTRPLESYAETMFGTPSSSSYSAAVSPAPAASSSSPAAAAAPSAANANVSFGSGGAAQATPNGYVLLGCRHGDQPPLHTLLQQESRSFGSPHPPQGSSFSASSVTAGVGHTTHSPVKRESLRAANSAGTAMGSTPLLANANANAAQPTAVHVPRITLYPATAAHQTELLRRAHDTAALQIAGLTPLSAAGTGTRGATPSASPVPAVPITPVATLLVQRNGMAPGVDAQESWRAAFGQQLSAILSAPAPGANGTNPNGTQASTAALPTLLPVLGIPAEPSASADPQKESEEKEKHSAEVLPPALAGVFPPPHLPITGYDLLWRGPRGEHVRLQETLEEKLISDTEPKKRRGKKG